MLTPLFGNLSDGLAAELSYLLSGSELLKSIEGRLYTVGGIVGAIALCTNVLNADHFENRTDGAARDNAGTFFSGEHTNMTLGEFTLNGMRDGCSDDGNRDEVTLRILDALANRFGNLGSLTCAYAYPALFIADDDESGKAECTTALDDLGNTVDRD